MDRYKKNMTSGTLHLATVGRQAPAFFFHYIDSYISWDRWQQYDMHSHYSFKLNSCLAFLLYIRIIKDNYRSYSRSFHLYLSLCFISIFHSTHSCCFSFTCSLMSKWFQISGRFHKMIRRFTAVHLCYHAISVTWLGGLGTSKNKMHPQNKMLGSDPILFSDLLVFF